MTTLNNSFIISSYVDRCGVRCPTPLLAAAGVNIVTVACTRDKGHEGEHAFVMTWEAAQ